YQRFGLREPFIHQLVPVVVEHMGGAYPELKANPKRVQEVIRGEESDFLATIERGLIQYAKVAQQAQSGKNQIEGEAAFDLNQTYGFPLDLTRQMASEQIGRASCRERVEMAEVEG